MGARMELWGPTGETAPAWVPALVGAPAAAEPPAAAEKTTKKAKVASGDEIWKVAAMNCVLLRRLPASELKYVKSAAKTIKLIAGASLYKEGDACDSFYVVQSGHYVASRAMEGSAVRYLREYVAGDTIGSHELFFSLPRESTLTAIEGGSLWVIGKRIFDSKLRIAPAVKPAMLDYLRTVPLFAGMTTEFLVALARAAVELHVEAGKSICIEGDAARDVYAIKAGELATSKAGTDMSFTMCAPNVFGESALLCSRAADIDDVRTRMATVKANEAGATVLVFDVAAIECLVGFCLQDRSVRAFNRKLLASIKIDSVAILDVLMKYGEDESSRLLDWLADAMVEEYFEVGDTLAVEGAEDSSLYVIKAGEAAISTKANGELATIGAGAFFGELSLLTKKHKRTASIVAKTKLRVATLPAAVVKANEALEEWRNALGYAATRRAVRGTAPPHPPSCPHGRRRSSAMHCRPHTPSTRAPRAPCTPRAACALARARVNSSHARPATIPPAPCKRDRRLVSRSTQGGHGDDRGKGKGRRQGHRRHSQGPGGRGQSPWWLTTALLR